MRQAAEEPPVALRVPQGRSALSAQQPRVGGRADAARPALEKRRSPAVGARGEFQEWRQGSRAGITSAVARKKLSTTVYLTVEQDAALKELSVKTKVPAAEYIRQGVDLILEKHREELSGQAEMAL